MVQFVLSQLRSRILQTLRSCWSSWFATNDFTMLQVKAVAHTCLTPHTFYFIVICTSIYLFIHILLRLCLFEKTWYFSFWAWIFLVNMAISNVIYFFMNGMNPSFICDGHWGWLYLGYCVQYSVRHEYAGVFMVCWPHGDAHSWANTLEWYSCFIWYLIFWCLLSRKLSFQNGCKNSCPQQRGGNEEVIETNEGEKLGLN